MTRRLPSRSTNNSFCVSRSSVELVEVVGVGASFDFTRYSPSSSSSSVLFFLVIEIFLFLPRSVPVCQAVRQPSVSYTLAHSVSHSLTEKNSSAVCSDDYFMRRQLSCCDRRRDVFPKFHGRIPSSTWISRTAKPRKVHSF